MKLNPIKSNMTEIETNNKVILFSYETPVAAIFTGTDEVWKTSKKWSNTTTRHINTWLKENGKESLAMEVDQQYLDNLLNEVK